MEAGFSGASRVMGEESASQRQLNHDFHKSIENVTYSRRHTFKQIRLRQRKLVQWTSEFQRCVWKILERVKIPSE